MITTPFFLRMALPVPMRRLFDYLPPDVIDLSELNPGIRIAVPFQSRIIIGILTEISNTSDLPITKLKKAHEIIDKSPIFNLDTYKLCQWAATYYHYPLGEVLISAIPALLRKGRPLALHGAEHKPQPSQQSIVKDKAQILKLNDAQQNALNEIITALDCYKAFLLDGVTGSGKTEIYLQAIAQVLQSEKQVLVLVPEISLTPQTIARFTARFNVQIAVIHSNLTDKQRLDAWHAARDGDAKIIIGTRSAIFTAFHKLGLIIVDEEHDASFKQQERFRYHARDLAVMRASLNQIPIVLGSATPSLESLHNVARQRYQHLRLPERAGNAQLPQFKVVDLNYYPAKNGLSEILFNEMRAHLNNNNQVMLFLNRRGFSPVLYCTQCAWMAGCKRCDARLVYHRTPPRLHCHHCDIKIMIPTHCEKCQHPDLMPVGLGTQRLEDMLTKYFPSVPILRFDRDNTTHKGNMQKLLDEINTEKKAILLGTQMLAKGHHFPQVTLVGIIDADSGFFSTDFRATEQLGQLILQVAGRSGRAEKKGLAIIQTRHPEHPLLQTLIQQGYAAFAQLLLHERAQADMPPYTYSAIVRAESRIAAHTNEFLEKIKKIPIPGMDIVTLFGPAPATIAKRNGLHGEYLMIKAQHRNVLQKYLYHLLHHIETSPSSKFVKWTVDIDPIEVG